MRTASASTDRARPPDAAVTAPEDEAPDAGVIGVGGTTQEVRVAVAMSGGVSLAVWMGGVAREVNLLQQASNVRQHEAAAVPVAPAPGRGDRDSAAPAGRPGGTPELLPGPGQ